MISLLLIKNIVAFHGASVLREGIVADVLLDRLTHNASLFFGFFIFAFGVFVLLWGSGIIKGLRPADPKKKEAWEKEFSGKWEMGGILLMLSGALMGLIAILNG